MEYLNMATGEQSQRVISISLGSSSRNAVAELVLAGKKFIVERIGTDGDLMKAKKLLESLDGKAAAFGLGGTDLYVCAGNERYTFKESAELKAKAEQLENEALAVDTIAIENEIAELKEYLPHDEQVENIPENPIE